MGRSPWAASVLVAFVLCCAPSASADPILINGSFESGPVFGHEDLDIEAGSTLIPGWTVFGTTIDYLNVPWDVSDGLHAVDLDGRDSLFSGIEQTFSTAVGQRYMVAFDLSGNPGRLAGTGLPRLKQVRVSVGGLTRDYTHDSAGQSVESLIWQPIEFSFIASDTTATLSFMSLTPFPNSFGALIDNVQVTSVPEPGTLLLTGVGAIALALSRCRRLR